jgi:ABC-type branched-subunit amino acid transport system ATPase component/ABC-type branched-subunit amino acid transport system permease subunit
MTMLKSALRHPLIQVALALALLPVLNESLGFTPSVASEVVIFALVGLGFNLLLGYTGLVSFGHGAYVGIAAYTAALVQIRLLPGGFVLPIVIAVLLSALLGLVIGFLSLRRRGVYFSLLTLAFTAMIYYIVYRWTSFTGGENGLGGIVRPVLLGWDLNDQRSYYVLVSVVALCAAWLALRVVRSPFGSVLVSIRENEQRAVFLGYSVRRYKLLAFVLSTTFAGLGGALLAYLKYFVSADMVHVTYSGEILAMSIIGGMRHFLGPALGALFFILFREVLSEYTVAWQFYFGLLFIAFILFSPSGLIGLGGRLLAPFLRHKDLLAAMASRVAPKPLQAVPAFLQSSATAGPGSLLLDCDALVKHFGRYTAVARVNLKVWRGRLQALIGPNGAGKTTLFNLLSGMYPPDEGRMTFLGQPITGLPAERVVAQGLARSFQVTNLFQGLSVLENLRLGIQAGDPRRMSLWRGSAALQEVNAQTTALVRFLGLEGVEPAQVADLSYGGQRLVEIGLALASKPRLLLLDEPLAGLSADERERVSGLIKSLVPHMGVLVIEHDIDRVFALSDSITVMNNGEVLVDGDPETVRNHPEVQAVYLGSGRNVRAPADPAASSAEPRTVLRLEEVNTYYGKSHILYDVSLDVREREVVALVGRNGAGKSSTFKTIMGLVPPRQGRILFEGQPIQGRNPEQVARLGIGLVPQGRRLFPNLTVEENLYLGALRRSRGSGVHWSRERIFEFFPKLRHLMNSKADVLSGGEQQMVAIARALSGQVKFLLLDEPFEGLSPAVKDEVYRSIDRLRGEISILIVEHDLDQVLSLANRVYVLDRGRVAHEGPTAPLLTDLEYRKQVLWL